MYIKANIPTLKVYILYLNFIFLIIKLKNKKIYEIRLIKSYT